MTPEGSHVYSIFAARGIMAYWGICSGMGILGKLFRQGHNVQCGKLFRQGHNGLFKQPPFFIILPIFQLLKIKI
jgi:hypothetical protein